jgi:hypothetical protein
VYCEKCTKDVKHDAPGPTQLFKNFIDKYASGSTSKQRNSLYSLRSGISHGGRLMQLDQNLAFGWDLPWWNEYELHKLLWGLTRVAVRNWLKKPPCEAKPI